MIDERLLAVLEGSARLFDSPIHGFKHWHRVARNGVYLAQYTGADVGVVKHFAYFHDCMRDNEHIDPEHGPRAALFLNSIRTDIPLADDQFELLRRACSGHTHGTKTDCPTLGTCWDADRLDLGRVGVTPDSQYLFTARAKEIADFDEFQVLRDDAPWPEIE
jgi:uncharacterized protein